MRDVWNPPKTLVSVLTEMLRACNAKTPDSDLLDELRRLLKEALAYCFDEKGRIRYRGWQLTMALREAFDTVLFPRIQVVLDPWVEKGGGGPKSQTYGPIYAEFAILFAGTLHVIKAGLEWVEKPKPEPVR